MRRDCACLKNLQEIKRTSKNHVLCEVFAVIFIVEMVIKLIALGAHLGP